MSARYYEDQQEYVETRNGNYGTYPGRDERIGILRNKEEYRPVTQQLHTGPSFASEISDASSTCQKFVENVVRPCFAEFLAVYVTIFLSIHLDNELTERHVLSIHRITLLAILDGVAACMFLATFKTVHLHPVITLSNMFSLATSWYICVLFFIMQLLGSTLAVATITAQRNSGSVPYIAIDHDIMTELSKATHRLMFVQFLSTALVVMIHFMTYKSERRGSMRIGRLNENPGGLFMAITMSSFLCLLHSTLNWNSLMATAITLFRALSGSPWQPFTDHYIYWVGPFIGSLLACFLYRLLYAPDQKGIIRCCEPKETHIL